MASSKFKKDTPIIQRNVFQYTISSLARNTTRQVTSTNFGYVVPEGYAALGVLACYTSTVDAAVIGFRGNSGVAWVRNLTDSALTNVTVTLVVQFIREDLYNTIN